MKIDGEWGSKKARWMIEREIREISLSSAPDEQFCCGLIEAYTTLNLLSDQQHDQYIDQAKAAVSQRRRALTAQRIDRILKEVPHDHAPRYLAR